MTTYAVTIASNDVTYTPEVVAEDAFNAVFKAAQRVTNYPAVYPRPAGYPDFTVTDVVNLD